MTEPRLRIVVRVALSFPFLDPTSLDHDLRGMFRAAQRLPLSGELAMTIQMLQLSAPDCGRKIRLGFQPRLSAQRTR